VNWDLKPIAFPQGTTPEEVVAGFESRVAQLFSAQSGAPYKEVAIKPPLSAGRPVFSREYSRNIVAFAARCLYLNEMLKEANERLRENASNFLKDPSRIFDRDNFHWHQDEVLRLIEMYGTNGTVAPGRITPETEALCLQPIWTYVSKVAKNKSEYKK
jgi:hypothetical protein